MQQLHSHVQDAGHRNSTFSECWSPSVKMTFPVNSLVRSHSNHYNLGKKVSLEDVKIKDYLGDLSIDGDPTLKPILKKHNVRVQMGSLWRQQGQ